MLSPWAVGLKPGDDAWVSVVECGAPVWRKGVIGRRDAGREQFEVSVDGRRLTVGQHDVRSLPYMLRSVS